nr:MAG TPA: hypothetical protein [Caudoviricetes sp.]
MLFFVCKIVRKFVHLHFLKSCFRFLSYKNKILKATLLINISAPTEIFFYTY